MYVPPHFKTTDTAAIEQLVREYSFATLVAGGQPPQAVHLPLQLETHPNHWVLTGHMAKANPLWKAFDNQTEALAIFMGPHAYVSPSWYNHRNVPTWNYLAVHLYGIPSLVEGEKLEAMLQQLMAHYENAHAQQPQSYTEIPPLTLEKDLRGVVGFEMKITRIDASFKLSQNRDEESYASVIEHLKQLTAYDSRRIAEEMEKRKK